ncbi:hypothetical protein BDY24DRAFT_385158 [Mrakia frigida]|uniref:uncharacterized protein n=1 Tax=Mrakia frigida TaxID=29902 RepID=UPI003FCC03B2
MALRSSSRFLPFRRHLLPPSPIPCSSTSFLHLILSSSSPHSKRSLSAFLPPPPSRLPSLPRRPYSSKPPPPPPAADASIAEKDRQQEVLVEEGGTPRASEREQIPGQYTELEVEDQMLAQLKDGEEVGGSRGSFVKLVEIGMREGLLHHKSIKKDVRVFVIEGLVAAGMLNVQAGSFDKYHYQPQMEHTSWVLWKLGNFDPEVHFPVQISTLKSFERLCQAIQKDEVGRVGWAEGQTICDMIEVFVACSETYSITHQHRPIRDQLEELSLTIAHALEMGFRVRANLAVCIECPYEGVVPPERVADIAEEMVRMGCFEVSLDDTTGRGDPGTVGSLVREVGDRIGIEKVACRFTDTFGLGISNLLTALSLGVRTFDSAVGGVGGSAFSPGATGSLSSEDVVYTLHNLGYHTGVNIVELSKIGGYLTQHLETHNNSRAGTAVLARLRWEDEDEIKEISESRRQTTKQFWDSGGGKFALFLVACAGLWSWFLQKKVMGSEQVLEQGYRKEMMEEMIRQELEEEIRKGDVGAREYKEGLERDRKRIIPTAY